MQTREECRAIARLWDRELAGESLADDERELIAAHVAACDDCRLEAAALEAMDAGGADGPPPYLEGDLARRRWIDGVLEATRSSPAEARRVRRPVLVVAAAAAVLALGAGALLAVGAGETTASAPTEPASLAEAASPAALSGRVLLLSGEASAGADRPALGDELRAGDSLATGGGRAVLELAAGTRLVLEPGSGIAVERLDEQETRVALSSGRMLAAVDPERSASPVTFSLAGGEVSVTGTLLSLEVAGSSSEVRVLRGVVEIESRGSARRIGVGECAAVAGGDPRPLSEAELRGGEEALRVLDLLGGEQRARIALSSLPPGASVSLDGVPLGSTPVAARVRPGYRSLELTLAGRAPVRELLDLDGGAVVDRVFDLPRLKSDDEAAPEREKDGREPASARAREPDASQLLARAQSLRAERRWKDAAGAYSELIRRFPRAGEARSALISLGTIQLAHLERPRAALGRFERYLRRSAGGALAQEAELGRIRALRALGRSVDEAGAIRRFLAAHPRAVQAPLLEKRLKKLKR
ncbi:MAG: FecR domain-containing protein [Polyangia bacterium]